MELSQYSIAACDVKRNNPPYIYVVSKNNGTQQTEREYKFEQLVNDIDIAPQDSVISKTEITSYIGGPYHKFISGPTGPLYNS